MNPTLVADFSDGRQSQLYISDGLLSDASLWESLELGSGVALLSNPCVAELYGQEVTDQLSTSVELIQIGDGEEFKSLDTYATVMDQLIKQRMDRDATVIALGGGVVGDLAGFVAATYLRGIRLIQIPTTLLAQVDSSVGGKTAINHAAGKNLVGAFYQPTYTLIDTRTLSTLPQRTYLEGLAEVVKYGVIYDEVFFEWLEDNVGEILSQNPQTLEFIIRRCCEIKIAIVSEDESEQGLRKILNFGHTFGHALEVTLGYGELYHGEAVAIGMVMASQLAASINLCDPRTPQRIENLLRALGLPTQAPQTTNLEAVMDAMKLDKKVSLGNVNFILPKAMGDVLVTSDVPKQELAHAINGNIAPPS